MTRSRAYWAVRIQEYVRTKMELPEGLPQWMVGEIQKAGVKRWLDRHVPKKRRLPSLVKLAKLAVEKVERNAVSVN